MSTLALSERLADAAGPIVVKEVRQGLRARLFAICFALLLVGCLAVALVAAAEYSRLSSNLGGKYLTLFLGALCAVEFFVIPYSAYRSMSREREDETWVLLALTGLGPRRIVRGKVTSALAQGVLYASAIAPFVLFSYYLNGVDLVTLLVALGMAACWTVLLVCLGVALASQPSTRVGRALTHVVVLAALGAATAAGVAFGGLLAEEGSRLLQERASFAAFCAGTVLWALTTAAVLLEGASSALTLATENASRGPRLAVLAQLTLVLAVGVGAALTFDAPWDAAVVGSIVTSLMILVWGVFGVSERDGVPPAFAGSRSWLRPGAVRSFGLVVALLAGCTLTWWLLTWKLSSGFSHTGRALRGLLAAPLYVLLYLSLGVLAGRTVLSRLAEPLATRVGLFAVVLLGSGLPPLLAVMAGQRSSDPGFNLLNPLVGLYNFLDRLDGAQAGEGLLLLVGTSALASFFAWLALSGRDGLPRDFS